MKQKIKNSFLILLGFLFVFSAPFLFGFFSKKKEKTRDQIKQEMVKYKKNIKVNTKGIIGKRDTAKWNFYQYGYPHIKKVECGKCKEPCHVDPKDRGGFTCIGISVKSHPSFFVSIIGKIPKCKINFNGFLVCKNFLGLDPHFKDFYFKTYYAPFKKCNLKVGLALLDYTVNSGLKQASLDFQRAYGLKADGIWGKKSIAKCSQKLDVRKYLNQRRKTIKKFKTYQSHKTGWELRIDTVEKYLKDIK